MNHRRVWDRHLWGIVFSDKHDPFLLGKAWDSTDEPRHPGEPTRTLLFDTRKQARAWAADRITIYKGNNITKKWKFKVVKVRELVTPYNQ